MESSRRTFLSAGSAIAVTAAAGLLLRGARDRPTSLLRPPGAGTPREFLARCVRCSQCVQACPSDVLLISRDTSVLDVGTPYVDARRKPCDLCLGRDEMKCVPACPTGALAPVQRRQDVRMGLAKVDTNTCYPYVGVSCRACWHACPFPDVAISFDEAGHPIVHEDACVGCGLCEHACLTPQPSIYVVPVS